MHQLTSGTAKRDWVRRPRLKMDISLSPKLALCGFCSCSRPTCCLTDAQGCDLDRAASSCSRGAACSRLTGRAWCGLARCTDGTSWIRQQPVAGSRLGTPSLQHGSLRMQ